MGAAGRASRIGIISPWKCGPLLDVTLMVDITHSPDTQPAIQMVMATLHLLPWVFHQKTVPSRERLGRRTEKETIIGSLSFPGFRSSSGIISVINYPDPAREGSQPRPFVDGTVPLRRGNRLGLS